jgi:DNA helicase IV
MPDTRSGLDQLNDNQRDAVTCDENRVLVLAGAGSGKTQTIIQRLVYLLNEKYVNSSNIIAITFTKNAANEMIDRLIASADKSGNYTTLITDRTKTRAEKDQLRRSYIKKFKWIEKLNVRTFHSLCYSILRNYGANEFDNRFRIIGEEKQVEDDDFSKYIAPETIFEVFHKNLIEICSDNNYLLDLKRYILDYLVDKIHLDKYENSRVRDGRYFTTLNGVRVRSKSEQYIGDWLYRHNIQYEYEPVLNIRDFDFHPDFYIPAADIYIEHISDKSSPGKDKEEQFAIGQVLYVKTFDSLTRDSALFNLALDNIIRGRLPENYNSVRTVSFREEFNRYHENVREFIVQAIRIMDMIKVENIDPGMILENSQKDQHERIRNFYKLAIPLINRYSGYCINKSYLDFNDLILKTILLLKNQKDISERFKTLFRHILVDEFQDVNNLQVELIRLLITDDTRLFCVGDDWQSIYGFRGSNVSFIIDFEKHFAPARIITLDLNYRSTQNIVDASNEVIRHNKFRIDKEISAIRISESKIEVHAGNDAEENVEFCLNEIQKLLDEGVRNEDILILYRRTKMFHPYREAAKAAGLKLQGKTIHAAKGLESKIVFVIGLTDGSGGFPDIWLEDRIFQVIKKADHNLLLEEERRLFYVAITRAKDKLYLITEKGNTSRFLREIPEIYLIRNGLDPIPILNQVKLCVKCSAGLEPGWIICPYCGTRVD